MHSWITEADLGDASGVQVEKSGVKRMYACSTWYRSETAEALNNRMVTV